MQNRYLAPDSTASNNRLILPPFGRILLAYQQENIRLDFPVYVYFGKDAAKEAYDAIREGLRCTFLPYNHDYTQYQWPVKGQKLVVIDTGGTSAVVFKKFPLHLLLNFQPRCIFLQCNTLEHAGGFFNAVTINSSITQTNQTNQINQTNQDNKDRNNG